MSTAIEQGQTVRIDLKGIIREALQIINPRLTNELIGRIHADEQKQLSSQIGPMRVSHIFGFVGRYAFGLFTAYGDKEILYQYLVSPDFTSRLSQYHIANLVGSTRIGEKLIYASSLRRDGAEYNGVSPEDGVAEVLLGERRVSQQPR